MRKTSRILFVSFLGLLFLASCAHKSGHRKRQKHNAGIQTEGIVAEIGGISLSNVEASVVDNINAPLLLGQTALAKFGRVTIDYNENTIEFN